MSHATGPRHTTAGSGSGAHSSPNQRTGRVAAWQGSWRGSWRIALRLARRDARRSKGRTALVAAMVGIPVMLIVTLSTLIHTSDISPRESLTATMGRAQAVITTTGDTRDPITQNPYNQNWGTGPSQDPSTATSRPWTLAELQALTGGRLLHIWSGTTRLSSTGIALPITATELPLADPVTQGMVQLRTGHLPSAANEIAATSGLLKLTGWKVGTRLTDLDTKATVTVVGTYRTLGMAGSDRNVLALPGTFDDPATTAPDANDLSNTDFLLVRKAPVDWAEITKLNAAGLKVASRSVITNPPPLSALSGDQQLMESNDNATRAVVLLIIVAIVIEVVLLAGPAFAVGVRRRRRDLALLAATGSTPRDIRRSVLAEAGLIGISAATAGALLGLPLAAFAVPVLEHFGAGLGPYDWRWKEVLGTLLVGCLAAVIAALGPAVHAARSDVATVLAGRRGVLRSRRGWPLLGLALVSAGTAAALTKGTRPGGEFWVAGGTIVIVLGAVAATPWLVGQVGRCATRFPLPLRLATRDASRQRARTAPAVAAIMASVIGITALAIGFASDTAQGRRDYEPQTAAGVATIQSPGTDDDSATEVADTVHAVLPGRAVLTSYDLQIHNDLPPSSAPDSRQLALVAPGCTPFAAADFANGAACAQHSVNAMGAFDAFTPQTLAAFGVRLTDHERQVLDDGGILVAAPALLRGDHALLAAVRIKADGTTPDKVLSQHTLPAALLPTATPKTMYVAQAVMTPQTARALGLDQTAQVMAVAGPTLTHNEADLLNEKLTLLNTSVHVERGYSSPYLLVLALLAGIGALIVLVATVTATALAMSEARPDLATLAAVGAPPRTRRYVASAQAVVIGLLGTLLGVALGFVPGLAVTWPLTASSYSAGPGQVAPPGGGGPVIAIPWSLLVVVVIAVPLVAGLVTGLCTRSRLPMVRRLAT